MNNRKILYGVCGIGMGHTLRQLPILEHFVRQGARLVVFAYGESYRTLGARYRDAANVDVVQVSVPFYVGAASGLDFAATALRPANFAEDTLSINCTALAKANALLGTPDLVVTDYEPVSAQYAYATGAPLVTIDQQSKYLAGSFPTMLFGQTHADEVQRLRMFFPRADARFACSFFRVPPLAASLAGSSGGAGVNAGVPGNSGARARGSAAAPGNSGGSSRRNAGAQRNSAVADTVQLLPPVLPASVLSMRRGVTRGAREILVYLSSQQAFVQSMAELAAIFASQPNWRFHAFVPASSIVDDGRSICCGPTGTLPVAVSTNVTLYPTGDARFADVLQRCAGIICTAGHSLLSEAMYLRKPVYALPLPVYDQQLNAHVIETNGFGIARPFLTEPLLAEFLGGLPSFAEAIRNDRTVLLRGNAQERIVRYLERRFLS